MLWGFVKRHKRRFQLIFMLLAAFSMLVRMYHNFKEPHKRSEGQTEVRIFAASSLAPLRGGLSALFEKPNAVQWQLASSATLVHQLQEGGACDVLIVADAEWMETAVMHKVVKSKPQALFFNRLVLLSNQPSSSRLPFMEALSMIERQQKSLALAEPRAVPMGRYAKEALLAISWYERLVPNLVFGQDARHTLFLLLAGEVDYAIAYESDARSESGAFLTAAIPESLHRPIVYSMAVCETALDSMAALASRVLYSDQARRLYEEKGFLLTAHPDLIDTFYAQDFCSSFFCALSDNILHVNAKGA